MISSREALRFNVVWIRHRLEIIKIDRAAIATNIVSSANAIIEEEKALATESVRVDKAIQDSRIKTENYQKRLEMVYISNYLLLDGLL